MKRIRGKLLGTATALAAAAFLTEPALNPTRQAEAELWQERWGTEGITCEGCCGGPNTFCCNIGAPCKYVYQT